MAANVFPFSNQAGVGLGPKNSAVLDIRTQWSLALRYTNTGAGQGNATIARLNVRVGQGGAFDFWAGKPIPYKGFVLPVFGDMVSELTLALGDDTQALIGALVASGDLIPRPYPIDTPSVVNPDPRDIDIPDFAAYYSIVPYIDGSQQIAPAPASDIILTVSDAALSSDSVIGISPRATILRIPAASHATPCAVIFHLFGRVG